MANILSTYSSKEVKVSWGPWVFSGLAPDFLSEEPNTGFTDSEVGADGSVSPSFSPDDSTVVTLTLQQQSTSNNYLSAALRAQKESNKLFVFPLLVLDPAGGVIASYTDAYIQGKPSLTRGSTATGSTMAWTFFVAEVKYGLGTQTEQVGNSIASAKNIIQ